MALLLCLALLPLAAAHVCVHDAVRAQVWRNATQPHAAQAYGAHHAPGRALATSAFAPIRIKALYISPTGTSDLSTGGDMTPALAEFVTLKLVPAAIARWSAMLSVVPVVGGLLFSPTCSVANADGTCASYSAALPSVDGDVAYSVPASLLAAYTTYAGSAAAAPVTTPAGAGQANADFAIFVTATNTTTCTSSPGTLAYAYIVERDQHDRPIWARVHFCPKYLSADASAFAEQLSTALHELNHALGFSAESFHRWRQSDGVTRRTPDTSDYTVTDSCAGTRRVAAPSSIAYVAERGMSASWPATSTLSAAASGVPWAAPGNAVAHVVTPKAAAAAQAYFACPALSGPELENQDTSSCFVQGSHYEGRMLRAEFMCSTSSAYAKVSPITLGLHEDSGWYTANYSAADAFQPGDWGYLQGCAFAQDKISASNVGSPPHFIVSSTGVSESGCTQDYLAKGQATVSTYTAELPTQYQYFSSSPRSTSIFPPAQRGGGSVTDYAPSISPFSNGACAVAANQATPSAVYGEVYGTSTSRCFTAPGYIATGNSNDGSTRFVCLDTACAPDKLSYAIKLSTGATATCSASGASVSFAGFSGTVTCGSINVICGAAAVWTPTTTSSLTATASATPSATASATATATATASPTATASTTVGASPTSSSTPSLSSSLTASTSSTPSSTPTSSASSTITGSATSTPSSTPTSSASSTITGSVSATPSPSPTPSPSSTVSGSASGTPTPSPTPSPSSTITGSTSGTPSSSLTPTASSTITGSTSGTPTPSPTPSPSSTLTASPTAGPTPSATGSDSGTPTPSVTLSRTPSRSASPGASPSPSPSAPATPSQSPTRTPTATRSDTPTPTPSPSPTPALTPGASPSATPSPTPTPSPSPTLTPTRTPTRTPSRTPTPPLTPGATPSATSTESAYPSATMSNLPSPTNSPTPSSTASAPGGSPSASPSLSPSSSPIAPGLTVALPVRIAVPRALQTPGALSAAAEVLLQWLSLSAATPVTRAPAPSNAGVVVFTLLVPAADALGSSSSSSRLRELQARGASAGASAAEAAAALTARAAARAADGSLAVALATSGLAATLGYDSASAALEAVSVQAAAVAEVPSASPLPPANPALPSGLSLLQASLQLSGSTPQFPAAVWGHYSAAVAGALRLPRAAVAVASVTGVSASAARGRGRGRALAGGSSVTMLLHLDAEACAGALGGYAQPLSAAGLQALAAQLGAELASAAGRSALQALLDQLPVEVRALTGGSGAVVSVPAGGGAVVVLQAAAGAGAAQPSPAATRAAAAAAADSAALAPGLLGAVIGVPAGVLALGVLAVAAVWRGAAPAGKAAAGEGQQQQQQRRQQQQPLPLARPAAPRLAVRLPASAAPAPPLRLPRGLLALLRSKGALAASGRLSAQVSLSPAELEAIGMEGYLALLQAGALREGMELEEEAGARGAGAGGVQLNMYGEL